MSARATLLWRLAACAVSVAFVLLYTSQQRHFQDEYDRLNDKYSKLMVHSDGLAAQLQCKFCIPFVTDHSFIRTMCINNYYNYMVIEDHKRLSIYL